jgi:Zn-finger nucleic acid-binding protein
MMLTCPRCGAKKLDEIEISDTVIDRCRCCGGLWFDSGEIGGLVGRNAEIKKLETTVPPDGGGEAGPRCPRCAGVALRELKGEGGAARTLFRCASCLGTWIDRGELCAFEDKQIIEALRAYFTKL